MCSRVFKLEGKSSLDASAYTDRQPAPYLSGQLLPLCLLTEQQSASYGNHFVNLLSETTAEHFRTYTFFNRHTNVLAERDAGAGVAVQDVLNGLPPERVLANAGVHGRETAVGSLVA
ncbi:hypothetical protein CPLU01_08014 [Colletotrichum plurivorum]|uniref:Uncharacterized protein n=1 Tax=Colletotrichum plurivorum TaxID=2175906 RepID=A0A8H6NE46_9PEZI|nr:hypothetical protein CPLU01_08014 [Colletotrichum plurivorum]